MEKVKQSDQEKDFKETEQKNQSGFFTVRHIAKVTGHSALIAATGCGFWRGLYLGFLDAYSRESNKRSK